MSPETTKNQAQLDSMVPALRGLSDLEHRHGALEVVGLEKIENIPTKECIFWHL